MAAILETVSGKKIDVLNPSSSDIAIEDIAWSLSRLSRFCGHTIPMLPYSVAQHSVQVMRQVSEFLNPIRLADTPEELVCKYPFRSQRDITLLKLHGLLHDAAESYIGDIPSPIKQIPEFREQIKKVEDSLLTAIYTSLGLPLPTVEDQKLIHAADMMQRAVEAYNFMYSRGSSWGLPKVSFKKLQQFEEPTTSVVAYDNFMYCYNDLRKEYSKYE